MLMSQLIPSIIRTVVPLLVALLTSLLVKAGIDPGPYQELIAQLVGGAVATAYYVAVRIFETYVKPRFGWLLGYAKQPTYEAPAAPSETSPTGAVATEDTTGVPAGVPVSVQAAITETVQEALSQPYSGDSKSGAAYHPGVGE